MTARISLLLPTRGRAALARRFLQSAADNAERPDLVEAVVYADQDDPGSHGLDNGRITVRNIVGPQTSMGALNMACFERASGDILALTNDDVIIRTRGWDRRLREVDAEFEDRIYLAYPNDLYKGARLCAFPVLSRRCCELLEEPFPRAYVGAFIDYHLLDIFRRLERSGFRRVRYLPDVVFEHMHVRAGKAPYDETYQRRPRFKDDDTFLNMSAERSRAAWTLRRAIDRSDAEAAPLRVPQEAISTKAGGAVGVFGRLASTILADTELPWKWRGFLFIWFVGRVLAARGLMPGVAGEGSQ